MRDRLLGVVSGMLGNPRPHCARAGCSRARTVGTLCYLHAHDHRIGLDESDDERFVNATNLESIGAEVWLDPGADDVPALGHLRTHYFLPLGVRASVYGSGLVLDPPTINTVPQTQQVALGAEFFEAPSAMAVRTPIGFFSSYALPWTLQWRVRHVGTSGRSGLLLAIFGYGFDWMPPGCDSGFSIPFDEKLARLPEWMQWRRR